MANNWRSIPKVLVLCLLVAQVVPFAHACIPLCRQLGLLEPPSGFSLPTDPSVTKYCWITYSGNSYSQMSGNSVQHTSWTGSLVEVKANDGQDIQIQINPSRGSATSQGNPGLTGEVPGIRSPAFHWPQNGEVVPLGFVYSGDGTTLETQIDMTGTNYAIDDTKLNIKWCTAQGNSFSAMGQSWSGHGMLRKYRVAGTNVFAAGGCTNSNFDLPNYRIPIIRVIGGDGSGTVLAQSEVQFGTSADQDWWFVTQHKVLFIQQKWVDNTTSVAYRLDPSIKGPPDAAPASSTVWTGAHTPAASSGLVPPSDNSWICDHAPQNSMWYLLCHIGGFSPVYWDNVDRNGVAIRVPTFQIPVGSCVDTNYGQQAPATIDLSKSLFKISSGAGAFFSSYNNPASTAISVSCNKVSLLATAYGGGGGNWGWTGPSTDLNKVRDGTAPINLDLW